MANNNIYGFFKLKLKNSTFKTLCVRASTNLKISIKVVWTPISAHIVLIFLMKRRKSRCNHNNIFYLLLQENMNSNERPFYLKK
jgi:hypothetical protein